MFEEGVQNTIIHQNQLMFYQKKTLAFYKIIELLS
jgi:hypothetical protein